MKQWLNTVRACLFLAWYWKEIRPEVRQAVFNEMCRLLKRHPTHRRRKEKGD